MSPMTCAPRCFHLLLVLISSSSSSLFASPLVTHSLGVSTASSRLLDAPAVLAPFSLSPALNASRITNVAANDLTTGISQPEPRGNGATGNGVQSGSGTAKSQSDPASYQESAQPGGTATAPRAGMQTSIAGSTVQATVPTDGSGPSTAAGRLTSEQGTGGAIRPRVPSTGPVESNRAFPGEAATGTVSSATSQTAGSATDSSGGLHSPTNTQRKANTDTTAPVSSLAPTSPSITSQPPTTQTGLSAPVLASQGNPSATSSSGTTSMPTTTPTPSSSSSAAPAAAQAGQLGSGMGSQGSPSASSVSGTTSIPMTSPSLSSSSTAGGAAMSPAVVGTPALPSSSVAPSTSPAAMLASGTALFANPTQPTNIVGPASSVNSLASQAANGTAVTQPVQNSPTSVASVPSASSSLASAPLATQSAAAAVNNAMPSTGGGVDDRLAAQILIAMSPSLTGTLSAAGGTSATNSSPISTESAASALSTSATPSSSSVLGPLTSSDLPLPSVSVANQVLASPTPIPTTTGLAIGAVPQNIPEPRVLDILGVLVTILALRHSCGRGVPGFRWPAVSQWKSATATSAASRALATSRAWLARKL
jgi:hypothetical protein